MTMRAAGRSETMTVQSRRGQFAVIDQVRKGKVILIGVLNAGNRNMVRG